MVETQAERQARLVELLGPTVTVFYGGQSSEGPKSGITRGTHGYEIMAHEAVKQMVADGDSDSAFRIRLTIWDKGMR